LLLRDAHVTLISTMEHLVVANLLAGFQAKALQLLQRVFHMQVDALGPHHPQCAATRHKIILLEQGHEEIDEVDVVDNDKKEHMNNHKKANDSDIEIKDEIDKVKDVCDKIHDKNNIAMNGESNNDIKDGSNKGISNLDDSNHNDKDDQSPPMPFVDIQPAFVGDDDDDTRVERDGDFGSSHHDLSETNMLSAWRLVV
jgi:hypothetical protein